MHTATGACSKYAPGAVYIQIMLLGHIWFRIFFQVNHKSRPKSEKKIGNSKMTLRGYYTLNFCMLVCCLKIINTLLKNNECILKQIVQRTQKWHWNLRRPSSLSYCFDQYIIKTKYCTQHYLLLSTRGHQQKFDKQRSRLDVRKLFFSQRVVEPLNKLPESAINAPTLLCFKRELSTLGF